MTIRYIAYAQIAVTLVLILMLAGTSLFRIKGNISPSEPRGLWRLTHDQLMRGTYVVLKLPLKQIAALKGDTVQTTPEGTYINGKLWPHSAIPAGVRDHFPFGNYVLHTGQVWVLGQHPFSWDSRYFGPIPETLVDSTAKPLWTEEPQ
jgi:type IV secretory pathway protease TraF